jgi:vitamin B12 transporter
MRSSKFLFSILCVALLQHKADAQNIKHQLPNVVVTASRIPVVFSDLTRSVQIITAEEIKNAPVTNLQDLLQYVLGVDVKQRGVEGIQADVSIRGGSFEQTLFLVDGVKLSDPQTGHHNLNLPVSLDNIERIEVLKGQGSRIFGPNALSGIINIITKKGNQKLLSLQVLGGENAYYEGVLNASYPIGIISNQLSVSRKKSDGYTHNTEFETINFSCGSSLNFGSSVVNLLFGYNDKKFGANGFYTSLYPNQWEHITTRFLSLSANTEINNFSINPKVYWRRHDDDYILDYLRPSFYENIHETNVYGFELQSSFQTDIGVTSLGGEILRDEINSTNLGKHQRDSKGIFAEHKFSLIKDLTIILGAFAYDYSAIGWRYWPGIDFAYNIISNGRLYGSIGKAFRIPTYTELFYTSPASVGNKDLKHEETLNFEIGFNLTELNYNFTLDFFRKGGKNIIDWVRALDEQVWRARNIAEINTNGVEFSFNFSPEALLSILPVYNLGVSYTYLDSKRELENLISQYALDHLKHQLIININNYLPANIRQSWFLRYEDRVNLKDYFLVDSQLLYDFQTAEIFVKATNLFNKSYSDINNLPLPGRWIIGGAKLKFTL